MTKDLGASPDAVEHFSETADHYADTQYDEVIRSFMTVRERRVLELLDGLDLPDDAEILDAGCGPGYLVRQFADRGYRVTGLDGAEGMLRIARERLEEPPPAHPVTFHQGDIEALPFEAESFDLVCSTGVIEYLTGDETVLGEMYRVLRPGGHLILPVTNALSPVNWLDAPVEFLKKQAWFRRPFNGVFGRMGVRPIVPRNFLVRRHRPGDFRAALEKADFQILEDVYFYFLPWPRPFDKLLPGASAFLGERMERLGHSSAGVLGEGYLVLAKKSDA